MKFLALMGLAVIIQCASAMEDRIFTSDADARAFAQARLDAEKGTPADAGQLAGGRRAEQAREAALEAERLAAAQPIEVLESKRDETAEEDEGVAALDASSEEKDAESITLISQDDDQENPQHSVEVSRKAAEISGLVRRAMEVSYANGKFNNVKCSVAALQAIGEYLNGHDGSRDDTELAKPIRTLNMASIAAYNNGKVGDLRFTDAEFINRIGSQGRENPSDGSDTVPADMSAEGKSLVFGVILGANYLECTELLHLGCAKIATYIKGKQPQEIKDILSDNDQSIIGGRVEAGRRRRRLSKEDRSILSKMFGTTF